MDVRLKVVDSVGRCDDKMHHDSNYRNIIALRLYYYLENKVSFLKVNDIEYHEIFNH